MNIQDDEAKKDHTKRYLSAQDFEIWDALLESRLQYTYAAFKAAVVTSYPGAEADKKYSWTDIDTLPKANEPLGYHPQQNWESTTVTSILSRRIS